MQSPSKLRSDTLPLFLDASVVINLVASNYIDGILMALARPIVVTQNACSEFKRHPRDGSSPAKVIEDLTQRRRIQIATMSEPQFEVFLQLTAYAPPDDLGDGEAATLACADNAGFAVMDDKKAVRIAARDFPSQMLYGSLDLMCAEQVIAKFGKAVIAQAVYDSIQIARMRVPREWEVWIRGLLGKARASELAIFADPTEVGGIIPAKVAESPA